LPYLLLNNKNIRVIFINSSINAISGYTIQINTVNPKTPNNTTSIAIPLL